MRVLSEIPRRDVAIDAEVASGIDRDAKIEQLLLAGLDHYFAAQYEQAINVWTRALFLDRAHPRARAYIDRARSALAERQRQSEELLHTGVAAFQRGDGVEARRLLQAAIDGGAPSDEALAVLARFDRPGHDTRQGGQPTPDAAVRGRTEAAPLHDGAPRRNHAAIIVATMALSLVAVAGYVYSVRRVDWRGLWELFSMSEPLTAPPAPIVQDLSLPLPRRGEMALARAKSLAASGRVHDALAVLNQVRPTDAQRDEADRLRADLQRELLALTPMPPAAADREKGDRRVP